MMGYDAQTTYKSSKLGQTDLVFGLRSHFISRSVHAGLQISICCMTIQNMRSWLVLHASR